MKRIDTSNRLVNGNGPGKDGFRDGNFAAGFKATDFNALWCNGVQEEIVGLIEASGQVPSGDDFSQLLTAIRSLSVSTTVPATFRGYEILVTGPHLRKMVWNGTTYVRAPWHQPGMVLYSYDNPASIPGYLPIRADVSYNQANYPDLVARLGLSGAGTFALVELRGEFIRCLDNGRGVNAGRALRSAEAGDNRGHTHPLSDAGHSHYVNDPSHVHSAWTDTRGGHDHGGVKVPPNVLDNDRGANGAQSYYSLDNDGALPWDGAHVHAVGVGGALTGIYLSASATGIGMGIDGSEARPRNVAFPAWLSY